MRSAAAALLALVLVISGCLTAVSKPSLSYEITPCSKEAVRGDAGANSSAFSILETSDGSLRILQNQSYVCCANITLRMESEGKTIRIYEDNTGGMCRCVCPFSADMTITDGSGFGNIEVYGIKYRDVQGYELLFNTSIESGTK